MRSVDIIMATYNGDKYLHQQLSSIISQSHKNWRLLVSDDGSTDSTIEVIRFYEKIDQRIILLKQNNIGDSRGPALNFLSMIKKCSADFISFCDQDDIWFENKLEMLVNAMLDSELDPTVPHLVYGMGYHFYGGDAIEPISGKANMNAPRHLKDFIFLNGGIQGCSMLINRPLATISIERAATVVMHDHLISLYAFSFGAVTKVSRPLMLYRHHVDNVSISLGGGLWKKMRSFVRSSNFLIEASHHAAIGSFLETNGDRLSILHFITLKKYLDFPLNNRLNNIKTSIINGFSIYGFCFILIFKIAICSNIGKNKSILKYFDPHAEK